MPQVHTTLYKAMAAELNLMYWEKFFFAASLNILTYRRSVSLS